jgi:hypothetical protein
MCLSKITQVSDFPDEVVAYKAMEAHEVWDEQKKKYVPTGDYVSWVFNDPIELGVWQKMNRDIAILSDIKYERGFHAFKNEKDAMDLKDEWTTVKIGRVLLRGIICEGLEGQTPVIVAREQKLVEVS